MARMREQGLKVAAHKDERHTAELARITAAVKDIELHMTSKELAEYNDIYHKALTPREQAEQARKLEAQMAENRDKPSI